MNNDKTFMEHLQIVIQDHKSDENFTVLKMAKCLRYSRTQAFRKIKSITGFAPSAYLTEQRLLQADALLSDQNLTISIAQIAYSVGFKDAAYFSRVFKRRFGITAREFREIKKNAH